MLPALFSFAFFACFAGKLSAAEAPDFAKHIAPLFQQYCLDCHGKQDPEGGLVMETHAALMKGGDTGAAIVPGKSAESLLVKFLEGRSGKEGKNQFMPPGKKKHLEPAEIALIRAWIDAGAKPSATGAALTLNIPKIAPKVAPAKSVTALAYSPQAKLIAAGRYGEIELLDTTTHKAVKTLPGHRGSVTALAFSGDGSQLFAASGEPGLVGQVGHWSTSNGHLLRSWDAHPDALYALALSPDGKTLATGSYDQRIKLWDAATGKELRTLKGHNGAVFGLAFRPDGRVLASASADRTVKLWNPTDGSRLDTFSQPTKELYCVAFSPDGKSVVAGGADNRIRLWSVTEKALEGSNKLLYSRFGHEGAILKLAFSTDGKTLVSSASDKTVKLWNAAEVTERTLLEKQSDWAPALAVTSGGQVVVGRLDGTIGFYDAANELPAANAEKKSAAVGAPVSDPASSPAGTKEIRAARSLKNSVVPHGASSIAAPAPSEKSLGYPRASLRESHRRPPFERLAGSETGAPGADFARLTARGNRALVFGQVKKSEGASANKAAAAKKAEEKKAVASGKPVLTRVEPPGMQRGVAVEVKLVGKNLGGITALKFGDGKSKGEIVSADSAKPDEALVRITVDAASPRGPLEIAAVNEAGESEKVKLTVDDLPQMRAPQNGKSSKPAKLASLPVGVWGVLRDVGQHDDFEFVAKAGETLVFDLEARRIGSKAVNAALQLLDEGGVIVASNYGMEYNTDPFLAFRLPRNGRYVVRVSEVTLEGSAEHTYRLTLGAVPYVTGFFPLSAEANREVEVTLAGHNLASPTIRVKIGAAGRTKLPLQIPLRFRGTPELMVTDGVELADGAVGASLARARVIPVPGSINARLLAANEANVFAFDAKRGRPLVIETLAARAGSPADTKIEVLDAKGEPVPRMLFQAVRDSWINFRRQDANNPGVRIANWEEMDLNQFVWFNGDIQRIFRMPRGPDADTLFFTSAGKRRAWFDTTATAHALDDPCYVVEPRPLGAKLVPNGLPVFTLFYANDDDGERELGSDSRLIFDPPTDGKFFVRVTDARGMGGERFAYRLTVRPAQPDFKVSFVGANLNVAAGAGSSFGLKMDRIDGFGGEVRIDFENLPAGYRVTNPTIIEAGHLNAEASLFAGQGAKAVAAEEWSRVKVTATAMIGGAKVVRPVAGFTPFKLGAAPAFQIALEPGGDEVLKHSPAVAPEKPFEVVLAPGETVPAWLRVVRGAGNTNLINLDVSALPHGVIVDNIGLNGVQIRAGENEREIFFAAARWVAEGDHLCFAVTQSARNDAVGTPGTQTSFPLLLKIRKPDGRAAVR